MTKVSWWFAGLLFFATTAIAAELPAPSGWVNDFAGVISAEEEQQLTHLLRQVEQASDIEMSVVTLATLEGEDVEGYAVRLFEKWGIGKKGKNNGLLILASIGDRSARIEVGYGLEEAINDAFAGRVLRETIFPAFREAKYGMGLMQGAEILTTRLSEHFKFSLEGATPQHLADRASGRTHWLSLIVKLIILIALIALFIQNPLLFFLLMSGGRGGGGHSSGGFGGGFGGFGGGLSGGGGGSGRW